MGGLGLAGREVDLRAKNKYTGVIHGFGHESEHDLALMVSDFLENGSGGDYSWCSSDSDANFCDLSRLADKIMACKNGMNVSERELISVVHSLVLSIKNSDLHHVKPTQCRSSCIRFFLAKLLRVSGYDAAVCIARWNGCASVPGGDHEYIDVVNYSDSGEMERMIIDIDFRSHFEIARAVDSYGRILKSLPVIFIGEIGRLKQILKIMAKASGFSLKQNSMPLPPWRSLPYLQKKWQTPFKRLLKPEGESVNWSDDTPDCHQQCSGGLRNLQFSLSSQNLKKQHKSRSK